MFIAVSLALKQAARNPLRRAKASASQALLWISYYVIHIGSGINFCDNS